MKNLRVVVLLVALLAILAGGITLMVDRAYAYPLYCDTVDCNAIWNCGDRCYPRSGSPPWMYILPNSVCSGQIPAYCNW